MRKNKYDIIIIGCGSAGLSVGLFMNKVGLKVLMISRDERSIGGDCLNEGCVPSKAFIHIAKIVHAAKESKYFGLSTTGEVNIDKAVEYIYGKQEIIREHENVNWLREQGIDVVLGDASFSGKDSVEIEGTSFTGKKIVIATGSRPKKLNLHGIEHLTYYDNQNIFHLKSLPERLLVIGGGPIGIEIAQAMCRLGSKVTVVHKSDHILEHDDIRISSILVNQLEKEGIEFIFNANTEGFTNNKEAIIRLKDGQIRKIECDAIFVGIGRYLELETLQLNNAGIEIRQNKIIVDKYLRTTNKNIFVCGDVAGSLQFSHAAEFQARILLNNFFSPIKKSLNNDHMSWVTFTDPQVATFGLSEKDLKGRHIPYEKLEQNFEHDDRAIVDNYQYGKLILYISPKRFLTMQRILGGTMICPNAGELIQELILANINNLPIEAIFNKIYAYPVSSRINQKIIVQYKQKSLTKRMIRILQIAYKLFH